MGTSVASLLRRILRPTHRPDPSVEQPLRPLSPSIARRLIKDNEDEPLLPQIKEQFRGGSPGVVNEGYGWWVARDARGRVVGGVRVSRMGPDHPPGLDVAVDPLRQRQGFATQIYSTLADAGIDVEACSAASLAHRFMTRAGYEFMLARRRRVDPDAEAHIAATANICPGCGPCDEVGFAADRRSGG